MKAARGADAAQAARVNGGDLWVGTLYALAAGLMWGLVFLTPLLLPDYPAALQSFGRYLAFGFVCLPLAWLDRRRLRALSRSDWWVALELAMVGNLVYYLLLAASIQNAGGPLPTVIIGTLPVVIALVSRARSSGAADALPWRRLWPSLLLIGAGIALVNQSELARLTADASRDRSAYLSGALMALGALACWTWYPVRNAEWMRAHPQHAANTWATAQGLTTLPLAAFGYAGFCGWSALQGKGFVLPWGPRPEVFLPLMVVLGLLASWLATLCWNAASRRLPTAIVGQLIVFETLAALVYGFLHQRAAPPLAVLAGAALLIAGVALALRGRR